MYISKAALYFPLLFNTVSVSIHFLPISFNHILHLPPIIHHSPIFSVIFNFGNYEKRQQQFLKRSKRQLNEGVRYCNQKPGFNLHSSTYSITDLCGTSLILFFQKP